MGQPKRLPLRRICRVARERTTRQFTNTGYCIHRSNDISFQYIRTDGCQLFYDRRFVLIQHLKTNNYGYSDTFRNNTAESIRRDERRSETGTRMPGFPGIAPSGDKCEGPARRAPRRLSGIGGAASSPIRRPCPPCPATEAVRNDRGPETGIIQAEAGKFFVRQVNRRPPRFAKGLGRCNGCGAVGDA